MSGNDTTRQAMLAALPGLRAFATSLVGSTERADDLVQETLLRAMSSTETLPANGNVQAWLLQIFHGQFYAEHRKRRRDSDSAHANGSRAPNDFRTALFRLPAEQREALILVAGSGLPYEDVAQICGCAVGTIKSRVNRARNRLGELLTPKNEDDRGASRMSRPMVAAGGHRY